MKKITVLLAVTILITACRKDSLPEPAPAKPLKDIDGNGYDTVKIGTQFWMKQNLTTSHYRNGDPIPEITSNAVWSSLTTGAWCWYNNDSATYAATYGKLYNWYAVNDPRGLAPKGWHVPSDAEWTSLSNSLGGDPVAGGKMKETGTTHWKTPNTGATNSSGFKCLPGGSRDYDGAFNDIGNLGEFWSSTEFDAANVFGRGLGSSNGSIGRGTNHKKSGLSVRCLRD
jgi:uncharacterized protein (TIGR02145 family)